MPIAYRTRARFSSADNKYSAIACIYKGLLIRLRVLRLRLYRQLRYSAFNKLLAVGGQKKQFACLRYYERARLYRIVAYFVGQ